jgi:hypothetical protein
MIKSKTIKINEDCYEVLYILPPNKEKAEAESAVSRYSTPESPAILMQSRDNQWFITRKVKDVIFTDIENIHEQIESTQTLQAPGDEDGIDNTEKD